MKRPVAFPESSRFANLKKFRLHLCCMGTGADLVHSLLVCCQPFCLTPSYYRYMISSSEVSHLAD
ncbi:MAG: hypothetical protein WBB45_02415 [Cyclobacteriaceae bacterium]